MIPFSVLDLAPIVEGGTAAEALHNARDLAGHAERLGYRRFWMAEHHSMPGIASAATSVALAHVGGGTSTIRIGAGGIMLPNHSPLQIAEQFGTLESLFPGRVDLGLGRAPGTDQAAAQALRRNLQTDPDQFPRDVVELMDYLQPHEPGRRVRAIPGEGLDIPIWILGSSLFGAQLAAHLGLPYAFASHFAPTQMMEALHVYRAAFRPSAQLERPYVDARLQRLRRRHGRGSGAARDLADAGVRGPADRSARSPAAAGRRLSGAAAGGTSGHARSCAVLLGDRRTGSGPRGRSRRSSNGPAPTS